MTTSPNRNPEAVTGADAIAVPAAGRQFPLGRIPQLLQAEEGLLARIWSSISLGADAASLQQRTKLFISAVQTPLPQGQGQASSLQHELPGLSIPRPQ